MNFNRDIAFKSYCDNQSAALLQRTRRFLCSTYRPGYASLKNFCARFTSLHLACLATNLNAISQFKYNVLILQALRLMNKKYLIYISLLLCTSAAKADQADVADVDVIETQAIYSLRQEVADAKELLKIADKKMRSKSFTVNDYYFESEGFTSVLDFQKYMGVSKYTYEEIQKLQPRIETVTDEHFCELVYVNIANGSVEKRFIRENGKPDIRVEREIKSKAECEKFEQVARTLKYYWNSLPIILKKDVPPIIPEIALKGSLDKVPSYGNSEFKELESSCLNLQIKSLKEVSKNPAYLKFFKEIPINALQFKLRSNSGRNYKNEPFVKDETLEPIAMSVQQDQEYENGVMKGTKQILVIDLYVDSSGTCHYINTKDMKSRINKMRAYTVALEQELQETLSKIKAVERERTVPNLVVIEEIAEALK